MWAVAALCLLAIGFSILCFIAFEHWDRWAGEAPPLLRWFFLLMGAIFLIGGFRPRNWKPWRYFIADRFGIHFPSESPETNITEWLMVPWKRVGDIKKDVFYGGYKGPSIELVLSDEEIDRFFRNDKLTRKIFGRQIRDKGFFRVGYSNAFQRPEQAVRILNQFKESFT